MTVKGSCSCGNVSYEIDGKLHDASSCHCSMRRNATGSQSLSFALFPIGKFSWFTGKEFLSHYKSSEDMGIYFCSVCGSPLAGTHKGETVCVTLGCVEGRPEIKVEKHFFMGSKAQWETNPGDVSQYEEFPS